jgi:pimeloyl-ACP methyl ester carboxylesterase
MAAITEREAQQVGEANASGKTPVVFIHGLWLLPSSWDRWAALFEEAGYARVSPVWPDDPDTVEQARANPEVLANKTIGQVADHTAEVIGELTIKPALLGHSTGGLLAQILAGRGLSAATVAIDPGPFRGVLPLPLSALRSSMPVLGNPRNYGRAVTLTLDQFKYGWGERARRRGGQAALRHLPRGGARRGAVPDGHRQPQPLDRGQGRHHQPRPGAAAHHRRRTRPHRPVGDRTRGVQPAAPQPGRDRAHQDP